MVVCNSHSASKYPQANKKAKRKRKRKRMRQKKKGRQQERETKYKTVLLNKKAHTSFYSNTILTQSGCRCCGQCQPQCSVGMFMTF